MTTKFEVLEDLLGKVAVCRGRVEEMKTMWVHRRENEKLEAIREDFTALLDAAEHVAKSQQDALRRLLDEVEKTSIPEAELRGEVKPLQPCFLVLKSGQWCVAQLALNRSTYFQLCSDNASFRLYLPDEVLAASPIIFDDLPPCLAVKCTERTQADGTEAPYNRPETPDADSVSETDE